jgi:methylated-DNA-[protein]-cysteine S-methyltransferase
LNEVQHHVSYYHSPIGTLLLISDGEALLSANLHMDVENEAASPDAITKWAEQELTEYFAGGRTKFTVPLAPRGTEFQRRVWKALHEIPFGETKTYGEVAEMIGNENACRAVGGAVGKNPILIMIPCHRVIAAGGRPGGFSAGTDIKKALHKIEGISTT